MFFGKPDVLPFFLSDWLHVRQGCVLCRHGVQECKLLPRVTVGSRRPFTSGRGRPWQRVSEKHMAPCPCVVTLFNLDFPLCQFINAVIIYVCLIAGMNWRRLRTLPNYLRENTVLKVKFFTFLTTSYLLRNRIASCLVLVGYACWFVRLDGNNVLLVRTRCGQNRPWSRFHCHSRWGAGAARKGLQYQHRRHQSSLQRVSLFKYFHLVHGFDCAISSSLFG